LTKPQTARVFKPLILLAVLLVNFAVREFASTFVHGPHNYSENYSVALSLAYGKGFGDLDLTDARYSKPIRQFLSVERQELNREELQTYFTNAYHRTSPPLMVVERTLDLRVAALLWNVFGFNWTVLVRFYALFSTLVCLLIFFTTRRLCGSYWAGIFASLFYATSLVECWLSSWSVRDISPLWFSTIAIFWLVCCTDRGESELWNLGTIAMLGVLSLLGYGWRIDAYLLPPFLLVLLVAWLVERRRRVAYIAIAIGLFISGAWGIRTFIRYLGSEELYAMTPQAGFHVADYGESTRSNLFNVENSFEIPRDDGETYDLAAYYWHTRKPGEPLPPYLSPAYALATRDLYEAYIKYNAFNWASGFPSFYLNTLGNVAVPGTLLKHLGDIPIPQWVLWLGERFSLVVAVLFVIASLPMLAFNSDKTLIIGIYLFSLYYCVLFLLVLPEGKHTGIFVLPLAIVMGFVAQMIGRVVQRSAQFRNVFSSSWPTLRVFTLTTLLAVTMWCAGTTCMYFYSRAERAAYIHDILERSAASPKTDASAKTKLSITLHAEAPPQGFLFRIKNAGSHGLLIAQHIRPASATGEVPKFSYTTSHALHSNGDQYYFVTAVPALFLGDKRDYTCVVTLEGAAEFVSVQYIDLSTWKRPAFNTVFYDGETAPGSPKLYPEVTATTIGEPGSNVSE
jgi:hypothetical protein